MKATGSRVGRKGWDTISEAGATQEPADLRAIRKEISDVVCKEAVKMVKSIIEEIDIDHLAAMKYLFEMIGLHPATVKEEAGSDDPLARTLLHHPGLPEGSLLESRVTKDFEAGAGAVAGDAVE
jgi:hypothetical protein